MEHTAMELYTDLLRSRRLSLCSGIVLVFAFGVFAYAHLMGFQLTGEWMLLLFCFSEMLTAVFILSRTAPESVSVLHYDWIVGIAGTLTPLFFRPSPWGIAPAAKYAICAGVVVQIAGLVSLNRSVAVVAAKREIKTKGLYRFVRHPLYVSHFLTFTGYVLMNTTIENLTVYAVTMGLLFVRVCREEKNLAMDPSYREYMQRVAYRIIPFVY